MDRQMQTKATAQSSESTTNALTSKSIESPIKAKTLSFRDNEKALFALAIAQRQSPNFKLWCEVDESHHDLSAIFDKCRDYLCSFLQGDGSEKGFASRLTEIALLIETTQKDESLGGLFAYDAVITLELAYEAATATNEDAVDDASMMSITGIYNRIEAEESDEDPQDSELMHAELNFQNKIADLIANKGKHDGKKLALSLIREVLNEALSDGVSNIGLEAN